MRPISIFTIVETETTPTLSWRDRLPWRRPAGFSVTGKPGAPYNRLLLEFPLDAREEELHRRAARGFEKIFSLGASGVVLPKRFPFARLAAEYGLAAATPVPLYRRMAGRIACFAADEIGLSSDMSVALLARRATPALLAAAETLRHRAKGLNVWAGSDTEPLRTALRHEHGISAQSGRLIGSDIYIFFEVPDFALSVPDDAVVLNFSGGSPAVLGGLTADGARIEPPAALLPDCPESCDIQCLLSAFAASEMLNISDIRIKGLTAGGKSLGLLRKRAPFCFDG